jgi:hypothetical protein
MKVPMVKFFFKNGKELGLDLRYLQIDPEKSKDGLLIFKNEIEEVISVVVSNVNWMTSTTVEVQDHTDRPTRRRLDPRNLQAFL